MKKLLALVLLLALMAGICSGEDIAAWNLDDMIHPDIAQSFSAAPEMNITAETLPEFQKMNEGLCIRFAKEVGCIVVAPDYRLAPEHKYPANVEDCYSALVWMIENLPVLKDRVAVAGQSAGGGLTAAVALTARDKKGPAICFQMPLYPMLDCRNRTPSTYQIIDHRVWCRDFNLTAWEMYLGSDMKEVPAYAFPTWCACGTACSARSNAWL